MFIKHLASALRHALAISAFLLAGAAAGQDYKGPITIVVGVPAGGSMDMFARTFAEKLPKLLGQPVVVDNRTGAGGQIAARYVKGAPADGSVLFFTSGHTAVTVPLILKAPGFDPATDFKPISPLATYDFAVVVHPKTQATTLKELFEYYARVPNDRSMGVPAPGSVPEFIVGSMAQLFKTDIQPVAYRGAAPLNLDLIGGQVTAAVTSIADILQYVKSGQLRVVAVTNATPLLPDAPTLSSLGFQQLAVGDFWGLWAPAGISNANAMRVNAAMQQVLAMPDVADKMRQYGQLPAPGTPDDLLKRYKSYDVAVKSLIKAVDYKPQ